MWQCHVQDVPALREGSMEGSTGAMVFAIGKTVNARETVTKLCSSASESQSGVLFQWTAYGENGQHGGLAR